MKRLEKGRVNREKDGVPYPSFSPDPLRNFSDLGQSDHATCFHFEASLDQEIWVCFGKFSGHAPHLLGVRKLPFSGMTKNVREKQIISLSKKVKNVDNNLWQKL
jgi:hypothetical protein